MDEEKLSKAVFSERVSLIRLTTHFVTLDTDHCDLPCPVTLYTLSGQIATGLLWTIIIEDSYSFFGS